MQENKNRLFFCLQKSLIICLIFRYQSRKNAPLLLFNSQKVRGNSQKVLEVFSKSISATDPQWHRSSALWVVLLWCTSEMPIPAVEPGKLIWCSWSAVCSNALITWPELFLCRSKNHVKYGGDLLKELFFIKEREPIRNNVSNLYFRATYGPKD